MAKEPTSEFAVETKGDKITVSLPDWFNDAANKEAEWAVKPLSRSCLVLRSRSSASVLPSEPTAVMRISPDNLKDIIFGLLQRGWSGVIGVDAGLGQQKIYVTDGELTFASSTLMDHRLGEVIYRNGDISLEQWTECAVKVTRELKFGQVLLRGGTFNSLALWNALRLQVMQIVRTVFLAPAIYVELSEGKDLAPTALVFPETSRQIIEDAYYFGCMFRNFMNRISFDSKIAIGNEQSSELKMQPGTFYGDLLELIREHKVVKNVVAASRLNDANTIVALIDLVNRNICSIEGASVAAPKSTSLGSNLQSKLDAYAFLAKKSRQAFEQNKSKFPIADLKNFAFKLNPKDLISLYLRDDGEIHPESMQWIASQVEGDPQRSQQFASLIESLIQFLLQTSADLLPPGPAKQMKTEFKQLRA